MFRILILSLVSNAFAGSQLSQGHIKYSDVDGTKVDWKMFAPYSQFRSHLQRQYQRREDVKSRPEVPVHQSAAVVIPTKDSGPLYKPFSQVPHHLKQLLTQSYQPQLPYVDPNVFFHPLPIQNVHQPQEQTSHELQGTSVKTQSTVAEFKDQRYQGEPDLRGGSNKEVMKVPQATTTFTFDKSVPLEIQQLLHYQAQIPYNVIANHIIYKPDKPFVPEPLSADERPGPYQYRSRVYYAVKVDKTSNNAQEESSEKNNS